MNKHTPGPWSYKFNEAWSRHEIDSVSKPFGNGICRLSDFDDAAEADARLIAAAPEMLEALSALVTHCAARDARDGLPACLELQEALRILAKAESRT